MYKYDKKFDGVWGMSYSDKRNKYRQHYLAKTTYKKGEKVLFEAYTKDKKLIESIKF